MNLLGSERFLQRPSSSLEDVLTKKLLLSHDPDGRHLDSDLLLRVMENIMCHATSSAGLTTPPLDHMASDLHLDTIAKNNICDIEVVGSQEPLGYTIYKISSVILCKSSGEGDLHARTMALFDLLGNYRWDAKVALVLAAFATSYGEFCLIMQLFPHNPLAVSVAILKQLPSDLSTLKPWVKALRLLVKAMVDVTRCIVKFESLPVQHVELDFDARAVTKSQIYVASYWVIRSSLTCASQITAMKHEQEFKFNNNCNMGALKFKTKMHQKLLHIFKECHEDNQEVLQILFALKDDFPLKDCTSQVKLGVSELKDKVVILLVSKPELLPMEALFLLVQQIYDHPHRKKLEESYRIVWVPIPSSNAWTELEEESFSFLSNSLPWYSIRQPRLLDSSVVNYIRQVWNFKDEPLMVVVDSQGMVTNENAIDMVLIWGARAYPFSALKEKELWEEEKWTIQLMIDEIDPLLTSWIEEGRNLCIYGGDNQTWIREFSAKMKEITRAAGVQLEMVYVGKRNPSEQVKNILDSIDEEKLSRSLSFTKMHFFWIRLESMRRSKLRQGKMADTDRILQELAALLDFDDHEEGWAVMGTGSSTDTIKLQGINDLSVWGENVAKLGFSGALRIAHERPPLHAGPCGHSHVVPYVEGLLEGTVFCDKCERPMEKFVVYQ
ncbi:hypothetical protein L1049_007264 [Liquidambar formosana]|uniref:Protein SIEVE ELEMENT OCCLUSION C n=1 Tax=Liquidambar formosana TaxID=63359 RepID=A0AAP0WS87_LIQFO